MTSIIQEDQMKQLDVLVRQVTVIERKGFDKKQYLSACDRFRSTITSIGNCNKLDLDWQELVKKLLSILPNKNLGADVRKVVADCIGTIGFSVVEQYGEYLDIVFAAFNKASQKYYEERSMIMHAVCTSLELVGSSSTPLLADVKPIEEVMKTVKKILEGTESHVILTPLLNICLVIAKHFPSVFKVDFLEILDFAVGWYTEPDQPADVAEKCKQVVLELRPYFHGDVPSSIELMSQFIEDAKVLIEELRGAVRKENKDEVSLQKTALLMRSLATVLSVFSSDIPPVSTDMPPVSADMLPRLLLFAKKTFVEMNCIIRSLTDIYLNEVGMLFTEMVHVYWVLLQISARPSELIAAVEAMVIILQHPAFTLKLLTNVLDFFEKVFVKLPPDVTSQVLPTVFLTVIGTKYKQCSIIGKFLSKILTPRALPTLQAAYMCVREKLLCCFNVLKLAEGSSSDPRARICEEEAIFFLQALSTLAGAKNSLIGMMGLSPSLFNFLSSETPLAEKWFIIRYPACHLALLHVLKLHCEIYFRHDNFIANSSWFNDKKPILIIQDSSTCNHLAKIINVLSTLLSLSSFMWMDTRSILLKWIRGIAYGTSHEMLQQFLKIPEMVVLRKALLRSFLQYSQNKKVFLESPKRTFNVAATRVRQYTLLRRLAVFDLVQEDIFKDDVSFTLEVYKAVRACDREIAVGLWQTIPPPFFVESGLSQIFKGKLEFSQEKIFSTSFTSDHFKLVTDFLLNSVIPTYLMNDAYDDRWFEDVLTMIYSFSTSDYSMEMDHVRRWRWALEQTAQYCVDNRMKTPLGKPIATFLCFENEMRRLAMSALSQKSSGVNGSSLKDVKSGKDEVTSSKIIVINRSKKATSEEDDEEVENPDEQKQLTDAEHWWRVRALLETIELLDKLITYAGDGTVFPLSNISQPSRQFFITNAASCSNWLSRMCLITMAVAYRNSNYAQVVRLGACGLRNAQKRCNSPSLMEKIEKEDESVCKSIDSTTLTCLSWMVRALIELGGSQPILGLKAWTKKNFGVNFEWITCAAEMARGRIEQAVDGLVICAADENLPEIAGKTVRQLIITGLNMLRSAAEMVRVWNELGNKEMTSNPLSYPPPIGFEEIAWERMRSLVSFSPPSDSDDLSHVQWDADSRFQIVELKLMDIARSFTKNGRIDLMRRLGEDAHMLMLADTSTKMIVKASVLHVLASSLKDTHKTESVFLSDALDAVPFYSGQGSAADSFCICQQLTQWMENCHVENGVETSLKVVLDEPSFYLNACGLARKLGNLRAASRHIQLYRTKVQPTANIPHLQNGWPPGFEKDNFVGSVNGIYGVFNNIVEDSSKSKLLAASVTSKLLFAQGVSQSNDSFCKSAFAMLYDALSDEVDRLLYKANALFNGTPAVAPNALTAVLSHQLMLTAAEDGSVGGNRTSPKDLVYHKRRKDKLNLVSRSILRLAEWLVRDTTLINVALSRSARISWHLFGVELSNLPPPLNPASGLVGSLLSASCKLSFHLAKAYVHFAEWAYKCIHLDEGDSDIMSFTDDERGVMNWHLKSTFPSLSKSAIDGIINAVGRAEQLTALKGDVCSFFGKEFTKDGVCEKLFGVSSVLIEIWGTARSRTVAYVISCVHSYFAFLAEYGSTILKGAAESQGSIGTVLACLRIIQLFMKYPEALQTIVDDEFLRTDETVWKDILPQIFALLNHPLRAVRNSLCILLERIAEKSPHALCYPAIVGAMKPFVVVPEEEVTERTDELDEGLVDTERKIKVEVERSLMRECCQRIVSGLSRNFPALVENVTVFVQELQRINMLFEERWVFVLANLDHEMNRRIAQIESEKSRTLCSTHLNPKEQHAIIKEKTIILSEMVFRILEALYERTCLREPTSANERHFRDLYQGQITAAFENYKGNKLEPKKAWQPFKQLLVTLTQRSNKRGALTLSTADISPQLCDLKDTQIPMPGQEQRSYSEVVTISQITKQAVILPTKTRPKKIVFLGSDGKEYPFLFKGQEDLHLDERIMQLLRICNFMFMRKEKEWPPYLARHYSVTPLGSRSGLIQWVDGATPLFHVYRKWQNRKAANSGSKKDIVEVDRPSELFFRKLKIAFGANNLSTDILNDRQKWPLPILENVLFELIKETPHDLLSRELWIRAGTTDAWYRTTERFARSTAVMSMLGSILGLGDRHLDNVLVNLDSGQVIHIDYNVCFDKGRHLRVPETVPFRLTNNIVNALGPTQIEGTFWLSCEHTMEKLRAGKEVFLTILDTFVYDPLVDWAAAQEQLVTSGTIGVATLLAVYGTEPYPGTALPLTYSLFALRIKEFGVPWHANGDRLHYALLRMIEALEKTHRSREGILDYGSMVKGRAPGEEDVKVAEKERIEASVELKNSITEHKHLMHDFRPLLRSLAYSDEKFRDYLRSYKEVFIEPLLKGCKLFEEGEEADYGVIASLFRSVNENLDCIYDELLALKKKDDKPSGNSSRPNSKSLQRSDDKLMHKKQDQNVYAKTVSMRIKQKLEGRDSSLYDKTCGQDTSCESVPEKEGLSVPEQVEVWIRQATSSSNLALMYEGWTAWV